MAKVEHYKKIGERENKTRLLALLEQHGDLSSSQLKAMLRVSMPTLSNYLSELEGAKKIEATFSSKDRRLKRYKIKPESRERVEAQIRTYEAVKFIEGIPNPVHVYDRVGLKAVAAFAYTPIEQDRERIRKIAEKVVSGSLRAIRFLKLQKDQKIAFVLMANGGEKAE